MIFLVYALLSFFYAHSLFCNEQPVWDDQLDFNLIEYRLKHESVLTITGMSDFLEEKGKIGKADNEVKLVELESGLLAVFKSDVYMHAEVAAYNANKALRQRLVPPTVLRTINGRMGSLQFYVTTPLDVLSYTKRSSFYSKLPAKQLSDMQVFYFVFGQWDIHSGNQIISESNGRYFLALIDNAAIRHPQQVRYGEFAFVGKGEKNESVESDMSPVFPFDSPKRVAAYSYTKLHDLFHPYLPDNQIKAMKNSDGEIVYATWHHRLYVQIYADSKQSPPFTDTYYESTLKAYRKLTKKNLETIWAEWIYYEPERCTELIDLVLERRDQLINHAYARGIVII